MSGGRFWNEQLDEMLTDLWKANVLSTAGIAEKLGAASRNAVIGRAHRLGLETQFPKFRGGQAIMKRARKPSLGMRDRETARKILLAKATADAVVALPEGVELMDPEHTWRGERRDDRPTACAIHELGGPVGIAPCKCRWPLGTFGEPATFYCGAPAVDPLAYCGHHAARSMARA